MGRVAVGIATLAVSVIVATTASATEHPRPAELEAHGKHARSLVHGYCATGQEPNADGQFVSVCTAVPELTEPPRGRRSLNVAGRSRIRIRFQGRETLQDDVEAVEASLVRIGSEGQRHIAPVRRVDQLAREGNWRLVLPRWRQVRRANALRIHARFADGSGDVNHVVGLRPMGRQPLACPLERPYVPLQAGPIRGKPVAAARRIVRRGGCRLRVVRRNGRALAGTDDLRLDRINVAVRGGRVAATVGAF